MIWQSVSDNNVIYKMKEGLEYRLWTDTDEKIVKNCCIEYIISVLAAELLLIDNNKTKLCNRL